MANTPAQLEAARRYRESHREKIRAAARDYSRRRRASDPELVERGRARQRLENMTPGQLIKRDEIRRRSYAKHAERRRAEARAYRAAHPDQIAAANARWAAENYDRALSHSALRRARIKGAPETEFVDRLVVFERDGGICHICGKPCSLRRFHVDHLVPLSKGGSHTYENVATAHPRCNLQRGDVFLPAQLRLVG